MWKFDSLDLNQILDWFIKLYLSELFDRFFICICKFIDIYQTYIRKMILFGIKSSQNNTAVLFQMKSL